MNDEVGLSQATERQLLVRSSRVLHHITDVLNPLNIDGFG